MKRIINISLFTAFSTTFAVISSCSVSAYQLAPRWSKTATDGAGLQLGDPTNITWSIARDGTNINGFLGEAASGSNLISFLDGIYGNGGTNVIENKPWFDKISASFNRWSELTGINYIYEPNDDQANFAFFGGALGVRGDVRLGGHSIDGNFNISAYNFFPNFGDMVIDTSDSFYHDTSNNSRGLRNILMHEQGHGIGLKHLESNNTNSLLEPFFNVNFDGPQFDDILGAQRLYGDALETKRGSSETIADAYNIGSFNINDTFAIGKDASDLIVSSTETDFISIDGISDTDFFKFTVSSNSLLQLDLNPLGQTYNQGPQALPGNPPLPQSLFNASAQSDLMLELFANDGITSLGFSNNFGLGISESLSSISLAAGDYFIKVIGTEDAAQFYSLDLSLSADNTASVPEPITILGSITALGFSGLFKKKYRKNQVTIRN